MFVLIKRINKDTGLILYPKHVPLLDIPYIQNSLKDSQMKRKYWLIWLPRKTYNLHQSMHKKPSVSLRELPKGISRAVFKRNKSY